MRNDKGSDAEDEFRPTLESYERLWFHALAKTDRRIAQSAEKLALALSQTVAPLS